MSKYRKERKSNSNIKWTITVLILTFFLSLFFSYISTEPIRSLNLLPASIILIVVILIGIFFDIVAVAVTVAGEDNFHAKATKKIKGAKTSIKLIRNSSKVSNFCADVIGDICGVLSGSIGALISVKIMSFYGISFDIQFIIFHKLLLYLFSIFVIGFNKFSFLFSGCCASSSLGACCC